MKFQIIKLQVKGAQHPIHEVTAHDASEYEYQFNKMLERKAKLEASNAFPPNSLEVIIESERIL